MMKCPLCDIFLVEDFRNEIDKNQAYCCPEQQATAFPMIDINIFSIYEKNDTITTCSHYTNLNVDGVLYFEKYKLFDVTIINSNINMDIRYCKIFEGNYLLSSINNMWLDSRLIKHLSRKDLLNKIKILRLFS